MPRHPELVVTRTGVDLANTRLQLTLNRDFPEQRGWGVWVAARNASGVGIPAMLDLTRQHATWPGDGCSPGQRLNETPIKLMVDAQGTRFGFLGGDAQLFVESISSDPADAVDSVDLICVPLDAEGLALERRTVTSRQGVTVGLGAINLATAQKFVAPQSARNMAAYTTAADALSLVYYQGQVAIGVWDVVRAVTDPQDGGPWVPKPVPGGTSLGLFYTGAPPGAAVDVVLVFEVDL